MKVKELYEFCKWEDACSPALRWLKRNFRMDEPAYNVWRKCNRWEWLQWVSLRLQVEDMAIYMTLSLAHKAKGTRDYAPPSRPDVAKEYRRHVKWSTVRDAIEEYYKQNGQTA